MNNKGFAGMGLLIGIFTSVIVFMMLAAFLPVIIQLLGTGKGDNAANCPGYVDPSATAAQNYSYDPTKATDTITCSILNFTPGMYVLCIIFAVIAGILTGRFATASQEPQYAQYAQYA